MSGGKSHAAAAKAARWDKSESDKLNNQLKELMNKRLRIEKEGYVIENSNYGGTDGRRGSRRRRGGGNSRGTRDGLLTRELDAQRAQRETLASKVKSLQEHIKKNKVIKRLFIPIYLNRSTFYFSSSHVHI